MCSEQVNIFQEVQTLSPHKSWSSVGLSHAWVFLCRPRRVSVFALTSSVRYFWQQSLSESVFSFRRPTSDSSSARQHSQTWLLVFVRGTAGHGTRLGTWPPLLCCSACCPQPWVKECMEVDPLGLPQEDGL